MHLVLHSGVTLIYSLHYVNEAKDVLKVQLLPSEAQPIQVRLLNTREIQSLTC